MSGDLISDWQARVRAAAADGRTLRLCGHGSKDFYGGALAGDLLETRAHAGVVAYEPTELYLTARAGTPLSEIAATLAAHGQELPFDAPRFGGLGTAGGALAAGLSGPARASVGALRDYVLGVTLIDGRGDLLRFGGQVIKNVAGYDVSRLMAGSLGTLALVTEVSFKVMPLPPARRTLCFDLPQVEALARLNTWSGRPLPIRASTWVNDRLYVQLAGAGAAVDAAADALAGTLLGSAEADALWTGVRDHTHAFFARPATDAPPLWRLSVPSTAPVVDVGAPGLIEWGGALRWVRSALPAAELQARAARVGGQASCFSGASESLRAQGVFAPLTRPLASLHQRLKASFDPHGVFGRGRLYPDF